MHRLPQNPPPCNWSFFFCQGLLTPPEAERQEPSCIVLEDQFPIESLFVVFPLRNLFFFPPRYIVRPISLRGDFYAIPLLVLFSFLRTFCGGVEVFERIVCIYPLLVRSVLGDPLKLFFFGNTTTPNDWFGPPI